MDRRRFLSGTTATAAATALTTLDARAQDAPSTAFVLVHGSWHGGWCWDLVAAHLNGAGFATVAIDLPGHGLDATIPESFRRRPIDLEAFATEPSGQADIGIDAFADAVIAGADRARASGADRVVAVGHSMGGVPITFAAAKRPELFDGLVYLAALAPVGDKPAGAYSALEEQVDTSLIGSVLLADPAKVGAIRADPRSTDEAYLAAFKAALAADVDDALLSSVMHLLTPDAPALMYGEVARFPDDFARIAKVYIRCTDDRTIVSSTSEAIVADMNATWPDSPTAMLDLESSHEAMFARPEALAKLLIDSA